MIEVSIYRDEEGRIREILQSGSSAAGSADTAQGVSLLLHTAAIGLQDYLKLNPQLADDADTFRCQVERDSLLNREIDAILETVLLGLKDLEASYADQLEVKEVASAVEV